jgi:carbon-monoxide dehydrogenase medium subunit
LKPFEYFEPQTVEETVKVLSTYGSKAKVLAGGTDLLLSMKRKEITPQYIVYIKNIPNLDHINYDQEKGLRIGALATHESIVDSPVIREKFELLRTACNKIGIPQIRNMGTIGGNICKAGPSQDTPPVLLVLEAELRLVSPVGERTVACDHFFIAPFQTVLGEAEILTEIQIPTLPPHSTGCYKWSTKVTTVDETLVGVAVLMVLDPKRGLCDDIRIGLCSVAPTPMRARRAEEVIRGKRVEDRLIEEAAQVATSEINPRSRAEYRKRMTRILVKQCIHEVWQKRTKTLA